MEKTDNLTTAKTLLEYYKANIDVHINYLLTLNKYMSISKVGYFELAPILESIRTELYSKVETYPNKSENTSTINKIIIIELSLMLVNKGVDDVIDYVSYNLSEARIILLSIAKFLNKSVKAILDLSGENDLTVTMNSLLTDMKRKAPASNLSIDGLPSSCIEEFLRSIKVGYKKDTTIIKYLYDMISHLKILTRLSSNYVDYPVILENIDNIYKEFSDRLIILDITTLAESIDILSSAVEKINKKPVEKQLQYDKIC